MDTYTTLILILLLFMIIEWDKVVTFLILIPLFYFQSREISKASEKMGIVDVKEYPEEEKGLHNLCGEALRIGKNTSNQFLVYCWRCRVVIGPYNHPVNARQHVGGKPKLSLVKTEKEGE